MRKLILLLFCFSAYLNSYGQADGKISPALKYKKQYASKQGEQSSTTRDDRPNIVFILLDDARWDSYQVNGGVPFFPTPNIDRIANEGVNFKICAAVLPLCTPSRGTFFTGLYPHKHGAVTNPDNIQGGLPWISSILQESGYSTYMAGKLGFPPDSVRGFDEYLLSTSEKYIDAKFSYFGPLDDSATTIIPGGHTTDIITDFAADFIRRHADDDHPFFVFIPHRATHVPLIPRPEDDGLFDNDTMPYPDNAEKYQSNFPSYLYPWNQAGDSVIQDSLYRGYFELLAGVEFNVGRILDTLEFFGVLDNTVVFFTSDNGNIKSEHLLQGKQLPYEESLRIPMFIRYPEWFAPGTVIDNEIAANIDWAPTLLDIAGIPDAYGMDGVSLRQLANHQKTRNQIMYEVWQENETPSMRAVRTLDYKYIFSYCEDTTEQFFDLKNDAAENINLINDPSYQVIINYYRCKLDSMRRELDDNVIDTVIECKLKSKDSTHVGSSYNPGPVGACIFPPFDGDSTFVIVGLGHEPEQGRLWNITIFNLVGEIVLKEQRFYSANIINQQMYTGILPPGIYIALFEDEEISKAYKVFIH